MNMLSDAPRRYRIVFRGECGAVLASVFSDVTIESHDGYTCVIAVVRDESEFYGLLGRFADLALRPISLNELGTDYTRLRSVPSGTRSHTFGPEMDTTTWLARMAARDPSAPAIAVGPVTRNIEASALDARSHALIRLAGLVARGGAESAAVYEQHVRTAIHHGVSPDEIAGALIALLPAVGAGRMMAAAALIWPVLVGVSGISPADGGGEQDQDAGAVRRSPHA